MALSRTARAEKNITPFQERSALSIHCISYIAKAPEVTQSIKQKKHLQDIIASACYFIGGRHGKTRQFHNLLIRIGK